MTASHAHHAYKQSSEETAADVGLPWNVAQTSLVAYRSMGIGVFGAVMRCAGMPLEKIALYMNSTQVSGKGQLAQAARLTFSEGWLAPYRVVGPASITAWFLQYSVMGMAFQAVDQALSQAMGVRPTYYGKELMEPANHDATPHNHSPGYNARVAAKTVLAPVLASALESFVANRAEVQRYFGGPTKYAQIESALRLNAIQRVAGPAFVPNAMRNVIMCQTSFILTPIAYKLYFPQEHKSKNSLFWFGLGLNIFCGNVIAITQQALWGRSLDYLAAHGGRISYAAVVREGLSKEGMSAFFTAPKWFSRVLMNAPAQGTLPWFYNEILPMAEYPLLMGFKFLVYDPFLAPAPGTEASPTFVTTEQYRLSRTRTRLGTLPTAHPDYIEQDQHDHQLMHEENQRLMTTLQPRRSQVTALATTTSSASAPEFTATSPATSR